MNSAVIAAAGRGSRMHPATSAIEKPLLPLGRFPIIYYVLSECSNAGIENVVVVTTEGSAIPDLLYPDSGRTASWLGGRMCPELVFRSQDPRMGYGTAIPLRVAHEVLRGLDFIFMTGDETIISPGGFSHIAQLLQRNGAAILGQPTPTGIKTPYDNITHDGMKLVSFSGNQNPSPPSKDDMYNVSRYKLPADALEQAAHIAPDPKTGEMQITTIVERYARSEGVEVVRSKGEHLDVGNEMAYLNASQYLLQHPEVRLSDLDRAKA